MDSARIAELLHPFTGPAELTSALLSKLQRYLDLLLHWNARINLTAVRDPEQIVARHFGESLFAARALFPESQGKPGSRLEGKAASHSYGQPERRSEDPLYPHTTMADVGSGAGFPGIPMKLFAPDLELTLIESQNKKATFLGEVVRTLGLDRTEVFCGRAEEWGKTANLVTMRAVEQFERVLPIAAEFVTGAGRLCLLIGARQTPKAQKILGADWTWQKPNGVPQSTGRVVLVGSRP